MQVSLQVTFIRESFVEISLLMANCAETPEGKARPGRVPLPMKA